MHASRAEPDAQIDGAPLPVGLGLGRCDIGQLSPGDALSAQGDGLLTFAYRHVVVIVARVGPAAEDVFAFLEVGAV